MPTPDPGVAPRGAASFDRFALAVGVAAAALGLIVLGGHAAGVRELTSLSPGDVPTTPNTALGLIGTGIALVLVGPARTRDAVARIVGTAIALSVALLSLLAVGEYVTGLRHVTFSLGPLMPQRLGVVPGQMPLLTAIALSCLGGAILVLAMRRREQWVHLLALGAIGCGFVSTVSYLYDSRQVALAVEGARMALPTGISLMLLGIALMRLRPDAGFPGLLRSRSAAGIMARRLLPFAITAPAMLALVRLWGQRVGWYGTEFGLALFVVSVSALLVGLIWTTSLRLDRVERARLLAARELSDAQSFAHVGSWTMDMDTEEVSVSDELMRLIGLERAGPMPAAMLRSSIHPDDFGSMRSVIEDATLTGEDFVVEYRVVTPEGRERVFLTRGRALQARDGMPLSLSGVTMDVTQLRHAEGAAQMAEDRYRVIVQSTPDGVWLIDDRLRTSFANPALLAMLRCDAEDINGTDVSGVVHHDDRRSLRTVLGGIVADPEVAEVRLVRSDATSFWSRLTISALGREQGVVTGYLVTVSDIDARRSADEALRSAYEQERVATEQLRKLDAMKSNLLTAVSHELRTPLTGVLGFAATLQAHLERLTKEERAHVLERLLANARKLDRLLSDLLDLDRISRGLLGSDRHRARVDEIVRGVLADAELSGRILHTDLPRLSLSVDASKVERIVENLVGNAIRYTPAGSALWVRLEPVDGGCMLVVEDEGPGVADEDKELVFEPFRRGSASSPHSPGTGVGLSLVARFAALHGGAAWVQDRPGGGASFRVTLAAQRRDADRVA